MHKSIFVETTLIFSLFLMLWQDGVKMFLMKTIFGHILLILMLMGYYYLDKYIAVLFCIAIVLIDYLGKKEPFFFAMNADANKESISNNKYKSEDDFRKRNCMNDALTYKGNSVKNDMVEHVFPEIIYKNGTCNPCDKKCGYDIIENDSASTHETLGVSTIA
jgi:hypothetical protein